MLIAFDKSFAGRNVGMEENLPDRMAAVLVKKGYVHQIEDKPKEPISKPRAKPVKK